MIAAHTPVNGSHPIHDMTIRQHYAGLAMQGIIAGFPRSATEPDRCAAFAVRLADHLIAALNATEKPDCIP